MGQRVTLVFGVVNWGFICYEEDKVKELIPIRGKFRWQTCASRGKELLRLLFPKGGLIYSPPMP